MNLSPINNKKMNLKENLDVLVAIGVIGIVLMIIIPLPKGVLDVLLALNITLSVVIMLITMFTTNVLQLSVFPTLLLVTTLFRLALNISNRSRCREHYYCLWRFRCRWKLCCRYYYIHNYSYC